jgi:molybdenum cofactor cytidylyltransferase
MAMQPLAALVLAAGASRRMGSPKALLRLQGRPFVRWVVDALEAAGAAPIVVVTRPELAAPIGDAIDGRALLAINPAAEEGMESTVHAGLTALPPDIAGVAVALVDQPQVSAATIRALHVAFRAHPGRIVLPRGKRGRRGHPVFFPAALIPELRKRHEQGLREVVWGEGDRVVEIEIDDPGCFANVNTPEDLASLQAGEGMPPERP